MILIVMITILINDQKLRRNRHRLLGLTLALALVATGCGSGAGGDADQLRVIATTSIWGDVVANVVGEDAAVEVIVPNNSDSHEYEPTPQQVEAIQEADLVIANGLGLEEGLADILEAAEADGANLYEVGHDLDPLPFAEHEEEEDHDHDEGAAEEEGHDHDEDPHIWFDPMRMATAAGLVAERLAEIDPSVDWASRAADYAADLEAADTEIANILSAVPEANRKLVTNHEALGYFADRYGFEVVGVVIPGGSTLSEPSSAEMAALVEEIEHEGVTTVFAETTQPQTLAETVAAEVGSEVFVIELYTESLGEPGSGAESLSGMLVTDATLIADALSG